VEIENFDISLEGDSAALSEESKESEKSEEVEATEEAVPDVPGDVSDISIEISDDISEENLPDFSIKETEELKELRENGAEPMTSAPSPEDADFLQEDPLAENSEAGSSGIDEAVESIESIDLSQAVIDEPDLSGDIQDNPLEEPSLEDISIDLDLDESAFSADSEEDEKNAGALFVEGEDDMELSIAVPEEEEEGPGSPETETAEVGGDLSLIPEGFMVEADDSQAPVEESEEETLPEEDLDILGNSVGESSEEPAGDMESAEAEDTAPVPEVSEDSENIPSHLKQELKTVLFYMDQLLESLPDEKIEEFARSEYYDTYKKLFKELGLV
jgi:hypothetical protein